MTTTPHLRGITALKAYLLQTHQTAHAFARHHQLDFSELAKLLRGERSRVSVATAEKIEKATGGKVGWKLWIPQKEQQKEED